MENTYDLLTQKQIEEIAENNTIPNDFPYLNDSSTMYRIIKKNPNLTKYVSNNIYFMIKTLFEHDETLSQEERKKIFYNLIDIYDFLPDMYLKFFDDKKYYISLATKNRDTFFKLYRLGHPYKDLEKTIFKEIYEEKYSYNPNDTSISYALESPIVLLNTLKSGNFYYIDNFKYNAYSDEVIDYIIKNNLLNNLASYVINNIPKLVVAKLNKNINYLKKLPASCVTKEVINYLENIDFNLGMLDMDKNNINELPALKNSKFMIFLLKKSFSNMKYLSSEAINQELVDYLASSNYIYQKNNHIDLLNYPEIVQELILKGDIQIILSMNTYMDNTLLDKLISRIKNDKIDIQIINNSFLNNNDKFMKFLGENYNLSNPYGLEGKYLYSNIGRTLELGLDKIFSKEEIKVIIKEIINNNFYIDMEGLVKNIDIYKFKKIYDSLYHKESKFNKQLNIYFFIKVTSYFSNNLDLLSELNKSDINDKIINNLSLAINNNEKISLNELFNYDKKYKKDLCDANISYEDKICKLLVGSNYKDALLFLNNIASYDKLLYLQIQFDEKSREYQLIEVLLEIILVLEKLRDRSVNFQQLFIELNSKYMPNSFFNLSVMQDNIMRLYALNYQANTLSKDELRKKGCSEIVDGVEIFHLEGENFRLYSHRENFNDNADFTGTSELRTVSNNYFCTTYESKYEGHNLTTSETLVYEMNDISNLIAFGNKDIFINSTSKPLFTVNNSFTDPIDMSFNGNVGYTPNEFDFLRINSHGEYIRPSFVVATSIEEAISRHKGKNLSVIVFDSQKNKELVLKEYLEYLTNIEKLSFNQLYILIELSKKNNTLLSEDSIKSIINRVNEFSEKEQYLMYKLLQRHGYKTDELKENNCCYR